MKKRHFEMFSPTLRSIFVNMIAIERLCLPLHQAFPTRFHYRASSRLSKYEKESNRLTTCDHATLF